MSQPNALQQLEQFSSYYQYDVQYLRDLYESSADAFAKFNALQPLSMHCELLSMEEHWIAKLAAMKAQDCGACLELNIKMALEAGVSLNLVKNVVSNTEALTPHQRMIYEYVFGLAANQQDNSWLDDMKQNYSRGQLLEFGLCAASAVFYPMVKRAVGDVESCRLFNLDQIDGFNSAK